MNAKDLRYQFAFRRSTNYVDARRALTSAPTSEAHALVRLNDALKGVDTRLVARATAQDTSTSNSRTISQDEDVLRGELIDHHLRTIVKVAHGLKGDVPGIGVLGMVKTNAGKPHLIEAATAFARKAEVYAPVLVEHGLPADFIGQLDGAIDAFRKSVDARGSSRADLRGATRGVSEEIALGRKILSMMDGVLTRMLRGQPDQLDAWRHAKRCG